MVKKAGLPGDSGTKEHSHRCLSIQSKTSKESIEIDFHIFFQFYTQSGHHAPPVISIIKAICLYCIAWGGSGQIFFL
jgi:hypothetical protein